MDENSSVTKNCAGNKGITVGVIALEVVIVGIVIVYLIRNAQPHIQIPNNRVSQYLLTFVFWKWV